MAGQQHGMVALDAGGEVVRPAMLWNDTRSAPDARRPGRRARRPAAWAARSGRSRCASFTVTKLRWLARAEPENAARVERVLLPHDWLTWRLARAVRTQPTTDRGDASGTGYWSPGRRAPTAPTCSNGRSAAASTCPRVAAPAEPVGRTGGGRVLAPGTGDNMGAALGLGLDAGRRGRLARHVRHRVRRRAERRLRTRPGRSPGSPTRPGGSCRWWRTLNAARVLAAGAAMLGVDLDRFGELALSAEPGAGGLVLLPYLDGERTPNLPGRDRDAGAASPVRRSRRPTSRGRAWRGCSAGWPTRSMPSSPSACARAGCCSSGAPRRRRPSAPSRRRCSACPCTCRQPGEYVAEGAARQAAWTLLGGAEPPRWEPSSVEVHEADPQPQVRAAYAALRTSTTRLPPR